MFIRNRTTKTVKPSPLSNRGCVAPPDKNVHKDIDLKGFAERPAGAPLQGACIRISRYPRVLATFVPPVIERIPRCGLVGGIFADNHF